MQISSTTRPDGLEVKLKGRLDAGWSDHVAHALAECLQSGQHAVFVDMAEVEYLSSAGIRILVLYARQFKSIQGSFFVVKASEPVRRILDLSGLKSLLQPPHAFPAPPPGQPLSNWVGLAEPGATAECFELESEGRLRAYWPGNPRPWLAGAPVTEKCLAVEFPIDAIGIGLGGFGEEQAGTATCLGEFLGGAGAVVCLPADGSHRPDYMLQEGALTPSLRVAYGAIGLGRFQKLLRFDKGPQQASLPLSSIVRGCLEANDGQPAGFLMVAETAYLIGVCRQKMGPGTATPGPPSLFAFPDVRDWFSFTTEPAFANTTSLIVGFASQHANQGSPQLLKPMLSAGELHGHFHAAAFPYQPLRKGKVDLQQTVRPLFESGQVLGLLHLLNDWREISGAGESRFLRGACWWAPLLV